MLFALAVCLNALTNSYGEDNVSELFLPTDADAISTYEVRDTAVKVVDSEEGKALLINFGDTQLWPNIKFAVEKMNYSYDWSAAQALAVTLSNPTKKRVAVGLRIDTEANRKRGRQASLDIPPGQIIRWIMPVGKTGGVIGMQGQPSVGHQLNNDVEAKTGGGDFDPKRIISFQVFMPKPKEEFSLLLHKVELLPKREGAVKSFVDRFGQFNGAEWPGKIHSEKELLTNKEQEKGHLKANGALAHYSRYGGWKTGPRQLATGRFQIKKFNGVWWFVDPDGFLFWSSGITGVRIGGNATTVAGREFCFDWLPSQGDPLAKFLTGKNHWRKMDFFEANLFRKYGENYVEQFYDLSIRRLQSWGINTIANWSDPAVCALKRVPYMMSVQPKVPRFVVSSFLKAGLTKKKYFPDPFDPGYGAAVIRKLESLEGVVGDPWLLGVFVDNELPWTARSPSGEGPWVRISVHAFCVNGAESSVKKALLKWLQDKYGKVDALNKEWGTNFTSWTAALEPVMLTAKQIKSAESDMLDLEALIAERYFSETRDALKKCDSDLLYMGPRFSGRFTPEVVAIAAKYCDVMSFNIYEYLPDMRKVDELAMEHDFPVIIGEFHFGALDRGMFHTGLRRAEDQNDRALKYVNYVEACASASWCVGAHWFQYKDQPLTGRGDGENYNIGFITETDQPYPEMIEAARNMHRGLYEMRGAVKNAAQH